MIKIIVPILFLISCSKSNTNPPAPHNVKDSLFVNFDSTQTQTVANGWTNATGDPHFNRFTTTSTSGLITFQSAVIGNYIPFAGNCAYPGNGNTSYTAFPSQVVKEIWYSYNDNTGGHNYDLYDSTKPKGRFSGLKTAKTYKVVIGGSLDSTFATFVCVTSYHVKGTLASLNGEIHYNCQNNTATVATFTGVIPSGSGTIDIYFNAFVGNDIAIGTAVQIWEE